MFFPVEMGNSLQQHRSAIGCFHDGTKWRKKDKQDKMFIWHVKKDLVVGVLHGVSPTSFVGRHHDEGGGGL